MGKRLFSMVLACAMACALCLGLAGCGGTDAGSSTAAADDAAAWAAEFAGTWDLTSVVQDGEEAMSPDDVKQMRSTGSEFFLNLDEDGAFSLVMIDQVLKGIWSADGTASVKLSAGGKTTSGSLEDGSLSLADEGQVLVFVKAAEAKEVPAEATAVDTLDDLVAE